MKKMILLFLMANLAISLTGATKFVINNGHFSPIINIQYDDERDLIFSAEEKGAISIWNRSEEKLRNHFQLTSTTIDKILISPSDDNIAVLSHDVEKYYLSVWNWNTEKQIFSRSIDEQPLFLEYSATGRYLFYGNVQNPSLTFLDARNGVKLNYMNRLPSIYDFGFLGSSEKTLMTYSSSGSIKYYDFRTSADKSEEIDTIKGLYNLNVIQSNNQFLTARTSNKVYLIDRLSGSATDTLIFSDLRLFYQNRTNGEALTVERSNRNYILKKWSTIHSVFTEIGQAIVIPTSYRLTSLGEAHGLTLTGDENGTLYKVNWTTSTLDLFSSNSTKRISDLSISGDTLTLSADDGLMTIKAPFFNNNLSTMSKPVFKRQENPLSGQTGILELERERLLIWNKDDQNGSMSILNTDSGEIEFSYDIFNSPIQDISYESGKIITLEKNGTIKIIEIANSEEVFSYSAIGLQDISMVDNNTLFAGRASTKGKSPAITINIHTKETLTVNDDRFLIFDSIAVEKNHQFYTLGLLSEDNITKTILKSHNYENLNEMKTLVIYPGEDINAQVLIDPSDSRTIYAKLGASGIYKIIGRNVIKYSNNKPVKKIYISGSILYSLNQDNSITLFKASSGQVLYTIHIFKDDAWALIPSTSDVYFGSEGVEAKILSYRNNRLVNLIPVNMR